MNPSATHFAPAPRKAGSGGGAPAMISATVMAGVPALVRDAFGPSVLRHAIRAAMIDIELIERLDCFIPQRTMTCFVAEVERRAGEPQLGLLLAREGSLETYGLWGEYLLGAERLETAVARAIGALSFHSRGDAMELAVDGDAARLSYFNATRGEPGYAHVAAGTAGALLSLLQRYVPGGVPRSIGLDLARPPSATPFEDTFGCPVLFDADAVTVCFDAGWLQRGVPLPAPRRLLTIDDVARGRLAPERFERFRDAVAAQVWAQVLAGTAAIDSTARAFDTSVRSLQRQLRREGIDFRGLVNRVRARRGAELLRRTAASITEISAGLGYAAPAGFARAFRHATGVSPFEFRRLPHLPMPDAG